MFHSLVIYRHIHAHAYAHGFVDNTRDQIDTCNPLSSNVVEKIKGSISREFDFRVLRQNRRIVTGSPDSTERRKKELENFHSVLHDVSMGIPSQRVRNFIVEAFVKGARSCGNADHAELEGSTSVFTKRRYRDRWNRRIVKRISETHNHTMKVKARVRARGARGQNWYSKVRADWARSKARTQALWMLTMCGDFHDSMETERIRSTRHLMRVMLVSNLDVEQRFANGTQGRLLYWYPDKLETTRKIVTAACPGLMCRFVKEASVAKSSYQADIDFIDVTVRQETMSNVPQQPVQLQLGVVPAYALTIHKVQALSLS